MYNGLNIKFIFLLNNNPEHTRSGNGWGGDEGYYYSTQSFMDCQVDRICYLEPKLKLKRSNLPVIK